MPSELILIPMDIPRISMNDRKLDLSRDLFESTQVPPQCYFGVSLQLQFEIKLDYRHKENSVNGSLTCGGWRMATVFSLSSEMLVKHVYVALDDWNLRWYALVMECASWNTQALAPSGANHQKSKGGENLQKGGFNPLVWKAAEKPRNWRLQDLAKQMLLEILNKEQ